MRAAPPPWLTVLEVALGVAESDVHGSTQRWLWGDGESGVLLDRYTKCWTVVAFSPAGSVTVRQIAKPDGNAILAAARLAGLLRADEPARQNGDRG